MKMQELAEKLGGNYWEKGDLKRIYLKEGYNTKKVKTTTYVFQDELGEFVVACKVNCPSQTAAWERSQEKEVKDWINERINKILSEEKESTDNNEVEELAHSEELDEMLQLPSLTIERNPDYKPRLTPVTHVCNLTGTSFIKFYHGCGKGVAYIDEDGNVSAFQYDFERYSNSPKNCRRVLVEMSCTQLCFSYNKI